MSDKPRVVVVPGTVRSQNDGDHHFIGVAQLVRLYELREGEYEIYRNHIRYPEETLFLYPRFDGNYERPEELK